MFYTSLAIKTATRIFIDVLSKVRVLINFMQAPQSINKKTD